MAEQDKTAGEAGQAAASEAEQPQPDGGCAVDRMQHMAGMMEHCACGSGMMAKMAGMMGGRPSKPAQREPKDPE